MQLKLQSALQRVAILLFFFGFTSSALWTYSTGNLPLHGTTISSFPLFTFPNNVPGSIKFSVNSSSDIQLCFQESIAPVTFASCDPNLHFTFHASTNTTALLSRFDEDISYDLRDDFFNPKKIQSYIELLSKPKATRTFSNSTHFLAGRQYWLAAAYTQNQNSSFSIDFTAELESCTPPQPLATPFGDCVGSPFSLPNNLPYQTALNRFQYIYFSVLVPTPKNASYYTGSLSLTFQVAPSEPTNGTFNLTYYIQRDSLPGFRNYDASYSIISNISAPFSIPTPLPGTYYLLTNNTYPQQLKLTVQAKYNTDCSITNSTDPNCPVKNVTYPSGPTTSLISGTQYFSFNTSELIFGVGTTDLTNAPPIYLTTGQSGWPSQYSYIAKAENDDVNFFDFVAQPINPSATYRFHNSNPNVTLIWRVAVISNQSDSYYFWANTYCPYNCAGGPGKTKALGTCDQTTGKCSCSSSKSTPLFCARKGLSLGWIIVIIIIVIIVVACAIGIPLALYLRQRRNKNYERV